MKGCVSVIIPVYNVENYLKECIDSVIEQSYSNLEIILINDGSTDSSKMICEEYEQKDNRVKLFNKKNGGLSSARNYGITKANGEFIIFIDSDDFIEKNMIEDLIDGCEKHNCDIGVTGVYKYYNDKNFIKESKFISYGKVNSIKALENLLLNGFYVCNKLFKKSLFSNIRFENKLYEDIYLVPYIVENTKSIYFSENFGYYYRQREYSIVHSKFDMKKIDYYYASNKVYKHFINNNEIRDAVIAFYCLTLSNLLSDMYVQKKQYKTIYKSFYEELKGLKQHIKSNNYISRKKKIMLYLHIVHLTGIINFVKKVVEIKNKRMNDEK